MFTKAVKTEAKLRLAIAGPSGSGKTYTALAIGTALANGSRVAVLDTEHGSASKYADLFDFDVLNEAAPFHPDKVTAAIRDAAGAGYGVLVLDSMSHFWNGPGGMTDIVEDISRRMRNPNSFAAWKDGTPIQQRMIESVVAAPLHIIATIRSKQDYILVDKNGKQTPQKVGMAPIQRDGFEYEFDVFMDMDIDNTGIIAKTRCPALTGGVFKKPGGDVAAILADWLTGEPAPPPPVKAPPPVDLFPPVFNVIDTDIAAAAGREFVPLAAKLLEVTEDAVKERMKALGYSAIPGKPYERVNAFHKVREYKPAAQPQLVPTQLGDNIPDYYEGMKDIDPITNEPKKLFD